MIKIGVLVFLICITSLANANEETAPAAQTAAPSTRSAAEDPTAELKQRLAQHPDNLKIRARLGQLLLQVERHDEVIQILEPYSHVLSVPSLSHLAEAYSEKDDTANEVRILKILAERQPESHDIQFRLAKALWLTRSEDAAIAAFRKSIQLKPDHREAYEALLHIFKTKDNRYESRLVIKDMIKRFGEEGTVVSELCRLHSLDGFLDEAVDSCKLAIRLSPKNPDNHVYLASVYSDRKEDKMANSIYVNAAKKFPRSEFAQYSTGLYFLKLKNYPVAVRYLEAAVKIDPKQSRSRVALGEALLEVGQHERSLDNLLEACVLDHKNRLKFLTALSKMRALKQDRLYRKYEGQTFKCSQ